MNKGKAQQGGNLAMPGIVEFPDVVLEAQRRFGDLFKNEPERRHFAEYLTGLLVADRKTVNGINAEFAQTTDQSCLNRWLTEVGWDVQALNRRRLAEHQESPQTRYSPRGVIPFDNTLVGHDGKHIEDVGWFWDHAAQRNIIAHDYLLSNYVCPSGAHYPLNFRRFRKREDCGEEVAFKDHTELFIELADEVETEKIPGDFTFDSYFTNQRILNHVDGLPRNYVGDLKFNRKLQWQGRELKAAELAALIAPEDRKPVEVGERRQWYFTVTVRIPGVNHRVRIVILWDRKNGAEAVKILVTNRTNWEVRRILGVYRKRWTGTETHHRDGKQHLGLGDCQVRNGEGQTRHMYLVLLAYSLLTARMAQGRPCAGVFLKLTTIGEACRAVWRETLGKTIQWVLERGKKDGWEWPRIQAYLALT